MGTALQPIQLPTADRVGQGTAVEQARAFAEVHATVMVAQQMPRNLERALKDMRLSCGQQSLAEEAFYRYSRAGSQINGETVKLARELARCWGNFQHGLVELRRDDAHGQSEVQAWAWDVETNTRISTTFIVPHMRDKTGGPVRLVDMRDIYENNTNMGARRLREMIFDLLPVWFTAEAVAICQQTLEQAAGEGAEFSTRMAQAVERFAQQFGVSAERLEGKLGAPQSAWTARDLAQLQVIYRSLSRHETTVADEFPTAGPVSLAEITGGQPTEGGNGATRTQAVRQPKGGQRDRPKPAADLKPTEQPAQQPDAERASNGQIGNIGSHGKRLGFEGHEAGEFVNQVAILAGAPGLADISALTPAQADQALQRLGKCPDRATLTKWTSPEQATLGGEE